MKPQIEDKKYDRLKRVMKIALRYPGNFEVTGMKNINQPSIIAATHSKFSDSFVFGTAISSEDTRVAFFDGSTKCTWALPKIARIIMVGRSREEYYADAIDYLERGYNTCMYVQGKIEEQGNISRVRKGVFHFQDYVKNMTGNHYPIIPATIERKWNYSFPWGRKAIINIGEEFISTRSSAEKCSELKKTLENMFTIK